MVKAVRNWVIVERSLIHTKALGVKEGHRGVTSMGVAMFFFSLVGGLGQVSC